MMVSVSRIDKLIGQMTLAEKLGQLTMTAAGYAVTGPVIAGDSTDSIRNGTHRQPAQPRRRAVTFTTCSESPSRNRGSAFRS